MECFSEFHHSSLKAGSKAKYSLSLFEIAGQMRNINLLAVKGKRPGPVMLVTAGVHGDEYEGIFALQSFFSKLAPDEISGTFLALPVCNVLAYENISRESPVIADGLNLGREFPGKANGSYTKRLAHELLSFAVRNLNKETDLLIDFHSGGTRYEYVPMIAAHTFSPCFERERMMCRVSGIENLWKLSLNQSTFNAAVSISGIASVGTEITGRGGARPEDVELYVNVLEAVSAWQGITKGEYKENCGEFKSAHTQYFETSGLFYSPLEKGCTVKEGDEIGKIYDLCGEIVQIITADYSGKLWAIRKQSATYAGEVICLIAR